MKSILIYKQNEVVRIHAETETSAGFRIAAEPYFAFKVASTWDEIFERVKEILETSNFSAVPVPVPSDWSLFNKEFLKKMQVKSLKELYKNAKLCQIQQTEEGFIRVIPYKFLGMNEGFEPLENDSKIISKIELNKEEFLQVIKTFLGHYLKPS